MAQCRPNTKVKEPLRTKSTSSVNQTENSEVCLEETLSGNSLQDTDCDNQASEGETQRTIPKRSTTSINLRSVNRVRVDLQPVPDVEGTGTSPTTHSIMKTKQSKEDPDKGTDEDVVEPKTRARKKASDINEDDKNKQNQDEPKTSKEPKKTLTKPKTVVKKRPLGIRKTKTLRSKKVSVAKKKVLRQTVTRARKAAVKVDADNCQEKEAIPLIPVSEIKKEPVEETTPNSRSSSPKTNPRKPRLSSDMVMMKSVLGDSSSTLVLGPRTSPYSMRSERSNSPSLFEGKNLRSGKPRKVKNNLLNEIVIKEQKKRRRLLSDSKASDVVEVADDCKKLKRGRSCSRDGSEISKCSDITESDISLNEGLNDTEGSKELNKKLDKSKTDLDIDIENNVQISTIGKVPSLNVDSKLAETKLDTEPSSMTSEKKKKKMSLIRSTSLDSDNNNSNRLKLDSLNTQEIEEKLLLKTENDTLFEERSSILNCMSKTFNSKEVSKNMRKARRGRKKEVADRAKPNPLTTKNGISSTLTNDSVEDKQESIDTLAKEINDLIYNLDQNIDQEMNNDTSENTEQTQTKPVSKFYSQSKPLGDNNSIISPDTPVKDKDTISSLINETTPSKNDDSENIRLHYEEDSVEKSTENREVPYKHSSVASIDKLMDRLKEFEEFDKRRQRQESESRSSDSNSVMVTSEVVLVNKSGADMKSLKDIQTVRSPEKVIEKENVLSCFENNSAISIVKRDQVRKSIDIDLPNSVTLIKRNSFSSRKESTSSNHSKESDAISIFEKSLGKDVTLTEIRKSVDKTAPPAQLDLHQFANPQQPDTQSSTVSTMVLNSSQISITPRVVESKLNSNEVQITKRKSRESISRKSSESGADIEEKMATLEKMRSPPHQIRSPAISITPTPVAVKSPEAAVPVETEVLAPPLDNVKIIPEDITLTSEVPQTESVTETPSIEPAPPAASSPTTESPALNPIEAPVPEVTPIPEVAPVKVSIPEPPPVDKALEKVPEKKLEVPEETKKEEPKEIEKTMDKPVEIKPKSPKTKSARNSTEIQAGPSNVLHETPESQKRKENVLRTLGLLTHKAANEAKMEKMKQKERIYGQNYCGMVSTSKGKTKSDYTGTLKTVIKLNRGTGDRDKKKYRSSLKMTFQKSKNRSGKPQPELGEAGSEDDAYYTIEKREGGAGATSDGGHRKSYNSNRLNNHDGENAPEPEPKETQNLVIPEKASSFSIHPGRLCMDQCFYCGGKFGLYDTPCHIAQMKSSERQKKVLNNEEKLTIDSCLCDACYRHVDRRANCPSYRKRPAVKQPDALQQPSTPPVAGPEKPPSPSQEEESEEEPAAPAGTRLATCHTEGCAAPADRSIRRKWLIKMRSSVSKLLQLQGDYPGLHTIPLCGAHHAALAPLLACALCRRRLAKHHNLHVVHHGYAELNPLLSAAGIPVQFAERPVLCKVCRYYCTLLQRPGHNDKHAHAYRRRLLQIYNVEIPPELEREAGDSALLEDCANSANKQRKKTRTKSKQRRSTDPEKPDSESSERTTESSPEKEKFKEEDSESQKCHQPLEEDIESLISSNKIPVPGAKPTEANVQSELVESEMFDADAPLIPVDKQTELQYLLQKQNNPAQFLPKSTNLTQKHKNILKIHNIGISKPGHQHRITDKNSKRIQKLGQIVAHKDKASRRESEMEIFDPDKAKEITIFRNIPLNDECTIETIPNKKPADINTLKNKWQMSESFCQVKKNLSELSKKLPIEKDTKKLPDNKYSNPVKRLETNPSISVRELFPGEEEMNLQCNIEFNHVKGVTPEGWEKCNTMIQYDSETKRLWTELQRPYGNQSSFLRHLILLEKYFRSGDLVLSHNASPHAANYSTSVQSRLRAYDNTAPEPRRNEPSVSLIEFRKKTPINGKSLLKTNQNSEEKHQADPKKFMPPPGSLPKKPKIDRGKSKPLPPELIAITPNVQGRKAIQNVLQNIQQLVKGVSASDPTEVAAAPVPAAAPRADTPKEKKEMPALKFEPPKDKKKDIPLHKFESPKEKKENTKIDTPKKHKSTSKAWRPTLMPITQENLAKLAREPLRLAVDGHNLPSLVQVLSAGNRYHITFEDYNKMCVIRRERQQRLQEREARTKRRTSDETTVVTEIQPSATLGNGGTVVQNIAAEREPAELQLGANAATILKNVGLKNITIAPILPKTAAATPALLVTSAPAKAAQPGTSAARDASPMPGQLLLPKIPKSLTVIPQSVPEPRP